MIFGTTPDDWRQLLRHPQLRWVFLLLEFLVVLVLAYCVWKQVMAIEDLTWDDELDYMFARFDLLRGASTYSLVYWVADLFTKSAVSTYYVGRALGISFLIFGLWLAARIVGSRMGALIAALVLVASGIPLVWPGVSSFAVGLLLVAFASIIRWPDRHGLSVAATLMWLAASARPEFWPAAALCSGVALWAVFTSQNDSAPSRTRSVGLVLVVLVIPMALIAGKAVDFGSSRTMLAVGQHYSLRHALPEESPWEDWEAIVDRDFGQHDSVLSVVRADPARFLDHIKANVLTLPQEFLTLLRYGAIKRRGLPADAALVLLVVLAGIAVSKAYRNGVRPNADRLRILWRPPYWPILLALGLSLATSLIIYPRAHYLQLWAAGLILIVTAFPLDRRMRLAVSVSSLLLLGLPVVWASLSAGTHPSDKPFAAIVNDIEAVGGSPVVATSWSQLSHYVPSRVVCPSIAGERFGEFIEREHVTVLVDWGANTWSETPGFREFQPADHGFHRPDPSSLILVRDESSG